MTKLLMLDSGAFTVWTRGITIDLQKYISFCVKHPDISCYVNLDVLPGTPNQKKRTTESIEASCKQGWLNYQEMLRHLPIGKIIPVYHYGDDIKWLDAYLNKGCPYIGISPLVDNSTQDKIRWLKKLRKYLFDSAGRPVVKTHGFAVTTYDIMQYWEWYSVDSSTWQYAAAMGEIFFPQIRGSEFAYDAAPHRIAVSPLSPLVQRRQKHVSSMSPYIRSKLLEYLEIAGSRIGEHEIVKATNGKKQKGESWVSQKDKTVLRPIVEGVANSQPERHRVNAYFIKQANKVLPIKHIYFAGLMMSHPLEYTLGRRLLSYATISLSNSKQQVRCLRKHLESMRRNKPYAY